MSALELGEGPCGRTYHRCRPCPKPQHYGPCAGPVIGWEIPPPICRPDGTKNYSLATTAREGFYLWLIVRPDGSGYAEGSCSIDRGQVRCAEFRRLYPEAGLGPGAGGSGEEGWRRTRCYLEFSARR